MTDAAKVILDPTGGEERSTDVTLAPRLTSLAGKTMGLLDNGKTNGALLLGEIGQQFQQQYRLRDVLMFTKPYFGTPVEQTQMQKIIATCDYAVVAIGD